MLNRIARARNGEGGFTLIEMLVVIVILAILAGVVIFGVTGLNDETQSAACSTDERTVRTAEEAYYVSNGQYTNIAGLVGAGLLVAPGSTLYTATPVAPTNQTYTVAAVVGGDCA